MVLAQWDCVPARMKLPGRSVAPSPDEPKLTIVTSAAVPQDNADPIDDLNFLFFCYLTFG